MEEKVVVSLVETSKEGIVLLAADESSAQAFRTVQEGLDYYEKGYKACHARSYESSMSACINNMQFSPSIVEFKDFAELVKELFNDAKTFRVMTMSSISGRIKAFMLPDQEVAKKYWENGAKPRLI